jgi:hypothetical protein
MHLTFVKNDNMAPIDVKKYNFTMNSKSVIRCNMKQILRFCV